MRMSPTHACLAGLLSAGLLAACGTSPPSTGQSAPKVTPGPEGSVRVRDVEIPPSPLLSAQARALLPASRPTEGPGSAATAVPPSPDMAARRRVMNEQLEPNVSRTRDMFPVDVEETTIAGISVANVTPKGGVPSANADKVFINLPGGGFTTGIRANGLLISIPVSSVGKYRVVTLTYRQFPEHRHPAAVEDLTAVYRELLKQYRPENIGMVGCSAGGTIISQAVVSFQQTGLPAPGVLGIYCAGLWLGNGDSAQYAYVSGGGTGAPVSSVVDSTSFGYFQGLDVSQPLLSPANDLNVLGRFPPTIFLTGTRDFWMSSAAYSHRRLLKAGVESDLLIYDGLGHGFMTNPTLPESRDAYEITAAFYQRHLGKRR